MNINGTVRIDLSGYVEYGHLVCGDRAVRDVYDHLAGHVHRFEVHIGEARRTDWGERLVLLLAGAEEVAVVGAWDIGVEQATSALRDAMAVVPVPRSAS